MMSQLDRAWRAGSISGRLIGLLLVSAGTAGSLCLGLLLRPVEPRVEELGTGMSFGGFDPHLEARVVETRWAVIRSGTLNELDESSPDRPCLLVTIEATNTASGRLELSLERLVVRVIDRRGRVFLATPGRNGEQGFPASLSGSLAAGQQHRSVLLFTPADLNGLLVEISERTGLLRHVPGFERSALNPRLRVLVAPPTPRLAPTPLAPGTRAESGSARESPALRG